jgi:3'-phosphoadenosine 5'-phosphosulfate sulfotransferase (PAPS reductase)/FAD synthetase
MSALQVPKEIAGLINWGALFVVSHSGGKDSQAMAYKLAAVVPAAQLLVVHASLGEVEWDGALELARDQAAEIGCPFIVASASKSFFDMVENRFSSRPEVPSFPSSAHRQCTSDLKRGPIQREVRRYAGNHDFTIVVNCMGLRAAESVSRSKLQSLSIDKTQTNSKRTWYDWLPIHSLSTAEVFATIADAGAQPHYAYAAGNERLSCVFCIFGSANDIALGAAARPELFSRYVELETRTGYTMHQSRKSLTQLAQEGTRNANEAQAPQQSPALSGPTGLVDTGDAPMLKAAEIGDIVGMNPGSVNAMLARYGYQRLAGESWVPTEFGRPFARTQNGTRSGVMYTYLVWSMDVIARIFPESRMA